MTVFREWPYPYECSMMGEEEHFRCISACDEAFVGLVKQRGGVIGGIVGTPLEKAFPEIRAVFSKAKISMDKTFYLGEIMLLSEFRKKGIGLKTYLEFENIVKETKSYTKICLCEIEREENHPKTPEACVSLDRFWDRLGYVKNPQLKDFFDYKEVGGANNSPHLMVFREKILERV